MGSELLSSTSEPRVDRQQLALHACLRVCVYVCVCVCVCVCVSAGARAPARVLHPAARPSSPAPLGRAHAATCVLHRLAAGFFPLLDTRASATPTASSATLPGPMSSLYACLSASLSFPDASLSFYSQPRNSTPPLDRPVPAPPGPVPAVRRDGVWQSHQVSASGGSRSLCALCCKPPSLPHRSQVSPHRPSRRYVQLNPRKVGPDGMEWDDAVAAGSKEYCKHTVRLDSAVSRRA